MFLPFLVFKNGGDVGEISFLKESTIFYFIVNLAGLKSSLCIFKTFAYRVKLPFAILDKMNFYWINFKTVGAI